eukprot:g15658.t1
MKTTYSKCAGTALIVLDDVLVPVENLMGKENEGFKLIMYNFNHERWFIVQNLLGQMRAALTDAFMWARQRKVFGKPLMDQAVIRNKLASSLAAMESVQSFSEVLTYDMNKHGPVSERLSGPIAMLKFQATRTAWKVADDTVQILGGRGLAMYPGGASFHEELLKRRKANTYKERRKEGRTVHTKASKTAITVASIALVFNAMAIAMPHWRTSWVALIGYGGRRRNVAWRKLVESCLKLLRQQALGLACSSRAKDAISPHDMFLRKASLVALLTGKWYGHLLLGNACLSPICKWYLLKCNTYFDFCIYSYSAAFVIVLGFIVHVLCLIWTCFLTGRSLRWASTWWPVAAMLHLGGSVFWIIVTEGIFDQLDEESWYPIPTPGAAFFLACVGGLGQLVCVWLGFSLKSMWPEVDPDDPSQFITDSEKSEERSKTKRSPVMG